MKKYMSLPVLLCMIVISFSGCGTTAKYQSLAKEHDFKYFFPKASQTRIFDSKEEAYDFVMTAQAKFSSSVNKPLAKGLPGKLTGPKISAEKPVAVFCFLEASDDKLIDLDKSVSMEKAIRDSISASIIFLVFYEDRGISLSSYYLQSGWVYSSAAQHSSFTINNDKYVPEYLTLWGNDKAFKYLWNE